MNQINLNNEEFNQICNDNGLNSLERKGLKQALNSTYTNAFLNPHPQESSRLAVDRLIAEELLNRENYYSERLDLIDNLGIKNRSAVNFDILKNLNLIDHSGHARQYRGYIGPGWVQLNKVGQVYFRLIFNKDQANTKKQSNYCDRCINEILEVFGDAERAIKNNNWEHSKEITDSVLTDALNSILKTFGE